jgi:hypothetical protein
MRVPPDLFFQKQQIAKSCSFPLLNRSQNGADMAAQESAARRVKRAKKATQVQQAPLVV